MYGKKHNELTKDKISDKLSRYPNGVGIYDLRDNLELKFKNNTKLANHLNISKVTHSKYLNSGNIYENKYRFTVNRCK